MKFIYLDNNATTQPHTQVLDAMAQVNEQLWANPSSVHRFGQTARQRIELARNTVASLIGARPRELLFTSGGTESNNLALRGFLARSLAHREATPQAVIITSRIEHASVSETVDSLQEQGVEVVHLPVNIHGCLSPQDLSVSLREHAQERCVTLVSVQWANNETGVVQPMTELAEVCRSHRKQYPGARVVIHTDATQAVGKVPVNVQTTTVDLLTMSAHKFHGPKGAGALYVRAGTSLRPQILGGSQEKQRRGGTENASAIVGMGMAAELAASFVGTETSMVRLGGLRDHFEKGIVQVLPHTTVNSGRAPDRLWNTSNLGFAHLEAEAILLGLSEKGLCASAGAACSSGSLEASPVLLAMGISESVAHGSVRFSIGRFNTGDEINQAIQIVSQVVKRLAGTLPLGQATPLG